MSDAGRPPLPATRVHDAAREVAVRQLSEAFGRGMLSMQELDLRMDRVYRAFRHDELQAVVQDLGVEPPPPLPVLPATPRIRATFSSIERSRITSVPPLLRIEVFAGNVELDLRHADFPAGVTEIEVRAMLGNVELTLPAHVTVEDAGHAVLGNFEVHDGTGQAGALRAMARVDGPVVQLTGRSLLSNVEIHHVSS